MSGLIDDLKADIDSILGVRDDLGAVLKTVYFVTRTWSGTQAGEGTASDLAIQMLPSPGIRDFNHDIRLREGGAIKQGDILLTNVSGNSYSEDQLDGSSPSTNIEKLFKVGGVMYQPISVRQKYVTWEVQLRRLSNQTVY